MSFKQELQKIGNCHYVLDVKVPKPVHVFMNDLLVETSEEALWGEVVTIANFPGVTRSVVTADAHASGNGIPVGVAVETDGSVIIPCAAGYDISCGMLYVRTSLRVEDIEDDRIVRAWMDAVIKRISLGAGKRLAPKQRRFSEEDLKDVLLHGANAITSDKKVLDRFERRYLPVDTAHLVHVEAAQRGVSQISSLGSGNHFIELDVDQEGNFGILVHTGSRGYGHGTAQYFFEKGADERRLLRKDKEKCWFHTDSTLGKQYIAGMNAAANFAIANRLSIYEAVADAVAEVFQASSSLYYEISHNMAQVEEGRIVHRKGATRAFPAGHPALRGTVWEDVGHPILIPGSMGTESAILFAEQKAADSIYSINHGCGRVMGRNVAKKNLAERQSEIDQYMAKMRILINTRKTPLDESHLAYKDIDQVLDSVVGAGLAKIAYKLRPRAVIKGE